MLTLFGELQVVDHMLASGCVAHSSTLRNVAIGIALQNKEEAWADVDRVRGILVGQRMGLRAADMTPEKLQALAEDKSPAARLTQSFVRRLTTLRDNGAKKRAEAAAAKNGQKKDAQASK
jgi:hypothetical protein